MPAPFPAPPATAFLARIAGVDLWRIDLDAASAGADGLLSAEERARAARFVFERDRRRFAGGRAALRRLLAGYGGGRAGALALGARPGGKPFLADGPPFNLSHSAEAGLLAVGGEREVGVDLERIRPLEDLAALAASALAPAEQAAWRAGGGDGPAFLRIWTRKEAALKALGVGLAGAEGAPPPAVETLGLDLLGPGWAAALALAGPARR